MRFLSSTLLLAVAFSPSAAFALQAAAANPQTAGAPATAPVSTAPQSDMPSVILQPSLNGILQALTQLHTEKWKAPLPVRDETDGNIRSVRHDLDTVLPPLLGAADGAHESVSQTLPVLQNITALYDVLLRVAGVAKMSAPKPQSVSLDQAMATLDDARRALAAHIQDSALAEEKKVSDLQAALRAVPPPVVAAAPPAPPPAPPVEKKRVPKKKPKPVPAATPASAAPTTP
ncbi:hypothetical protein [Granulicella arctica]|uniref:hypothetical protein n=1 Tax=Granulicella arctica TaxID=940613 RepID=UPI0021E097A0|nr:hypothetical protein [Granulicella arctica]